MKIIDQSADIININGSMTQYEVVERCGRVCYKSEDKITKGSAIKFCRAILKNGHHAVLEHGIIYSRTSYEVGTAIARWLVYVKTDREYYDRISPYIALSYIADDYYISMNFRVLFESVNHLFKKKAGWADARICLYFLKLTDHFSELFNKDTLGDCVIAELMYRAADEVSNERDVPVVFDRVIDFEDDIDARHSYHTSQSEMDSMIMKHASHTVVFTTNRGVSHELVRHRPASANQESTRYCNYSNSKFGGELTVIRPCYYKEKPELMNLWEQKTELEEQVYFDMLAAGAQPQEARGNLPHDVKTDLVITATENEWQHIVNLRLHGVTGAPHPQAKEAMQIALPMLKVSSSFRIK